MNILWFYFKYSVASIAIGTLTFSDKPFLSMLNEIFLPIVLRYLVALMGVVPIPPRASQSMRVF